MSIDLFEISVRNQHNLILLTENTLNGHELVAWRWYTSAYISKNPTYKGWAYE